MFLRCDLLWCIFILCCSVAVAVSMATIPIVVSFWTHFCPAQWTDNLVFGVSACILFKFFTSIRCTEKAFFFSLSFFFFLFIFLVKCNFSAVRTVLKSEELITCLPCAAELPCCVYVGQRWTKSLHNFSIASWLRECVCVCVMRVMWWACTRFENIDTHRESNATLQITPCVGVSCRYPFTRMLCVCVSIFRLFRANCGNDDRRQSTPFGA